MAQDVPSVTLYPTHPAPRSESKENWDATKQLAFVVFKWRRLIVGIFLLFTVTAGTAAYMKPAVRSASAQILIKGERTPLQISGFTSDYRGSQLPKTIKSELELIKSRQVLGNVAMKLLSNPRRDEGVASDELESMINSLTKNTLPQVLPDSNVVQVTYFADTSEEAERILRLIVDEYIEQQAAIQSGSDKLLKFYEQEKQRVEGELREAEDRLNEWQGKNATVSIKEQITSQIDLLESRRKALQETDATLEATKAKAVMLTKHLAAQPERLLMGQEQVKNPLVMKLREQLAVAEASLQDLLQRFTDKHRTVIEKKEQIVFLKKELAMSEETILGRETTHPNPLKENLKQQLSDAQALMSFLGSQKQMLERQVQRGSEALSDLREKKMKVDELSRLVDLHRDSFMLYGKKLEEGRIATGLGKEQLANVALIGPPYANPNKDHVDRENMVFLSALVGLGLGMAIAFGLEFFNNALRTRQDVEYYLGLPVLAAVPELPPKPLLLEYDREALL
jgi:uncharacterized protein involved in exopolysaccharide biosynthesis